MQMTQRSDSWQKVIATFPAPARELIDHVWDTGGTLRADDVGRLLTILDIDIGALMLQLLPVAQQYAIVPVSHYHVGAVAAGMPVPGTGWASLYLGANVEFSQVALSFTVHAEQSAINNAWLSGEVGVQALAISAAPCGYCRQFLYELVTAQQLNILLPETPSGTQYNSFPLTSFLPNAFGPADLGVTGGLMAPQLGQHQLALQNTPPEDPLIVAALAAASSSYAPYPTDQTFGYAGVAVQSADGNVYTGRLAENAAYNPSLSPLESALSYMNMRQSLSAPRQLVRCVLVEVPTLASQRSATNAVLAAFAPTVALEYYAAYAVPA